MTWKSQRHEQEAWRLLNERAANIQREIDLKGLRRGIVPGRQERQGLTSGDKLLVFGILFVIIGLPLLFVAFLFLTT